MSEAQEANIHRIVTGVDGSLSSIEALRWAVRQAKLTGGVVDAVIAWHVPVGYGAFGYGYLPLIDGTDFAELAAKTLSDATAGADLLVVVIRGAQQE